MTGTSVLSPINEAVAAGPRARFSLKPAGPTSGYVDGAWWPWSLDLALEIPALLAALSDRTGAVDRVSYDMAAWAPADRRITAGDQHIRLDGFRGRRPAATVHVVGINRHVMTLLVIQPTAALRDALETLRRAGTGGNQDTIATLLRPSLPHPTFGDAVAEGKSRVSAADVADFGQWGTDGGQDIRRAS